MATIPKPSQRVLFWNALISAGLALLGLLFFVALGFRVSTQKFTGDGVGSCRFCRYQVIGRVSSDRWTASMRVFAAELAALTLYALFSSEALLREEIRIARSNGRRPASWIRPLTGEGSLQVNWKQWALRGVVVAGVQIYTFTSVFAVRVAEENVGAGMSHPIAGLNSTFLYGGHLGVSSSNQDSDPRLDGSLQVANPFISYTQLYPNDTIEIPESWANTSLYLPTDYLPTLESFLYQSALSHSTDLGAPSWGTAQRLPTNLTYSRGGFPLGNAIYSRTSTQGLGINMTSYEQFSGGGIAGLPREFEFQALVGESWVTNITVSCTETLSGLKWVEILEDIWSWKDIPNIEMMLEDQRDHKQLRIQRNGNEKWQVFSDFEIVPVENIGVFSASRGTQAIVQTFVFPNWDDHFPIAKSFKCTYSPSEFFKAYMAFANKPIRDYFATVNNMTNFKGNDILIPAKSLSGDLGGRCLAPMTALPAARAVHQLISQGRLGSGGSLGLALRESGSNDESIGSWYLKMQQMPRYLEQVLAQTAQAYFSLVRQRVERADAWPTDQQIRDPHARMKRMFFAIERFGGGSMRSVIALGVLILFLISVATVLLRTCLAVGIIPFYFKLWYEVLPQTVGIDKKPALGDQRITDGLPAVNNDKE